MVVLITLLQSAEDADGTHLVGLVDHDGLEPALQCLVLLEVFLVLVECGGTDGTQFASREGGFEDVGGIHGTLTGSCSHEGVNLIDEEDDSSVALHHFVDDALETLLKLTLVFRSGDELTHVE